MRFTCGSTTRSQTPLLEKEKDYAAGRLFSPVFSHEGLRTRFAATPAAEAPHGNSSNAHPILGTTGRIGVFNMR